MYQGLRGGHFNHVWKPGHCRYEINVLRHVRYDPDHGKRLFQSQSNKKQSRRTKPDGLPQGHSEGSGLILAGLSTHKLRSSRNCRQCALCTRAGGNSATPGERSPVRGTPRRISTAFPERNHGILTTAHWARHVDEVWPHSLHFLKGFAKPTPKDAICISSSYIRILTVGVDVL